MKSDNTPQLWEGEEHPPLDLLREYQEEALSEPASHQVERHLLDCELCSDLLQGMTLSDRSTTRRAVGDLNAQLRHLGNRKRKKRLPLIPMLEWRAAATFLVLLCSIGLVVYFLYEQLQRERLEKARTAELVAQAELFAISASTDTLLINYPGYSETAAPATTAAAGSVAYQTPSDANLAKSAGPEKAKSERKSMESAPAAGMVAGAEVKNRTPVSTEELETSPPSSIAAVSKGPPVQTDTVLAPSVTQALQGQLAGVAVQDKTKRPSPDTSRGRTDAMAKAAALPVVRSTHESMATEMTIAGKQLRGQVLSEEGEPLPGVSILIKGTNKGTSTDMQGNFALTAPSDNTILSFNYIGYEEEELKVGPQTSSMKVELSPDRKSLEEVVVIGYGERRAAVVASKPEPAAGMKAFENYLKQHRSYPSSLTSEKVSGRVVVGFTVTAQGNMENIHIQKSLHPALDAEALRLIKEGPAWKPALAQGKPVPQEVKVSIRFRPE